ncbi:MAG: thrombospondin type 3 repeat-containing protein [Thermodesulfobacteriota bacterium]|nr:thrombospondin type 3 repeat-containing protein [Thermodesulfobacteriota bacterium]
MSRPMFLRLLKIAILFFLILPCGCGGHRIYYEPDYKNRFYVPRQIPVKPGMTMKPGFDICKRVNIVNAQLRTENVPLKACDQKFDNLGAYTHKWWGNLHMWTDTALGVLETELDKRGVTVTKGAPKILKLSITRACLFWAFHDVGCPLNLRVQTGDGYIRDFEVSNRSIDLYDSCDGAVTRAVASMFDDDNIRSYLTCPKAPTDSDCDEVHDEIDECPETPQGVAVDANGCPLDSDGDGVPDYLDECPGTPQGVRVDSSGCPLDTDGDGVPDYLDECPGTPRGVEVDGRGCPLDTDGDGVPDYLDECPGTPEGVEVDMSGCPLDTDGDGVPDYLDECPGTPRGMEVDSKGCPLDTDGDGVLDYTDQCPGTPEGAKVDSRGCWVLMDTLFDFDRYEIRPEYYPVLDDAVMVLQDNPSMKIEVQGHTCTMGTARYNRRLSENRARAVMDYLVRKGIERDRLSAVGYGLTRPKESNKTEAGRVLNRRVELTPVY